MRFLLLSLIVFSMPTLMIGAETAGPVAQWKLDDGQGNLAHDSSGNNRHIKMKGPKWLPDNGKTVLNFPGVDEVLEVGETSKLGITGPVSVELWLKPMRKAHGEAFLMGEGYNTFALTYYNTERACWYIGGGGNFVFGQLNLGEWNHVAASFDGKKTQIWINGQLGQSVDAAVTDYGPTGRFEIGSPGHPELPKFKGQMSNIRVYTRGLTSDEVNAHFKAEAEKYGFDLASFTNVKLTPYYYLDRGEIVLGIDYKNMLPLQGNAALDLVLINKAKPDEVVVNKKVEKLGEFKSAEATLPCANLATGDYTIRATYSDAAGARPTQEINFSCPAELKSLPGPSEMIVSPSPKKPEQPPIQITVQKGGGFTVSTTKGRYPFQSRISWPNGNFNILSADNKPTKNGEKTWKVTTHEVSKNKFQVEAQGDFYKIVREIEVFPNHVQVNDTYTNSTDQDVGLLIYNEAPMKPGQLVESMLSGLEKRGRQEELSYPNYSPTLFFTDANAGLGVVPIDDVYIVQSVPYGTDQAAGIATEKFALGPKKSYTLEWAIYPVESKDYYDFLNAYRKAEGRIGTVAETPSFMCYGPHPPLCHSVPDKNFVDMRNMKIGIIPCLYEIADDQDLGCEGFDILDFPKELQLLKDQVTATHKLFPDLKIAYHIAHSLYATNHPERFADSKLICADGQQASWGDGSAFGKKKQAEGWREWCFYPAPTNSYHKMMMDSIDVLMDDVGLNGGFMDGFLAGYGGLFTYDRWDEHTAEIDLNKKTITRKLGSVILLSQPSMLELARKIRSKGGVVIANAAVLTRTIANETYIIYDVECASGPDQHTAPTVTALEKTNSFSEREVYLDTLDKLSWGELIIPYGEHIKTFANRTYKSLQAYQYPMTFEEIRSGMVRGPERIVTMNSGVYDWPKEKKLHWIRKFDPRGAQVPNDYVTTADNAGVRTELNFAPQESAVIEQIPLEINSAEATNVRMIDYSPQHVKLQCNGSGKATIKAKSGEFSISKGASYAVTANGKTKTFTETDGALSIPLNLNGLMEIEIARTE